MMVFRRIVLGKFKTFPGKYEEVLFETKLQVLVLKIFLKNTLIQMSSRKFSKISTLTIFQDTSLELLLVSGF